jgi:hypothetical protein
MKIRLNNQPRIIILSLVLLSVFITSVSDIILKNQVDAISLNEGQKNTDNHESMPLNNDAFDQYELDNHSFLLNPENRIIPDSHKTLSIDNPFSLITVTTSQVFHPPAVVEG